MAGPGSVITIESDADFKEKVLKSTGPAIVDCFAEWCGPCKAISPKVTEFSKTYTNATFFKIDIDRVPETAAELGIRAMPTFLLYKDGQRLEGKDVVGANPLALETAVKELIA